MIAIVYFSGSGHTHLMATAIATGVEKSHGTATLFRLTGEQIINGRWRDEAMLQQISAADAIVFGSPTYMGGVAAQFKAFVDAASSIWFSQGWKDKIAGGFTHSGSPSGDKQGTLLALAINAAQHSMIWVGNAEPNQDGVNRLGSYLGVMGQSVPDFSGAQGPELEAGDRLTSERYGQRIVAAVARWAEKLP